MEEARWSWARRGQGARLDHPPEVKQVLVLSRKVQQSILLSCEEGQVRFKIIEVGRDRVSIGVEAPDHIKILREELAEEEPAST